MLKSKSSQFFWPSYTDIMTSLFFIMLVLYIITFIILKERESTFKVDAEKYRKIIQIDSSVQKISPEFFRYEKLYNKHIINIEVNFAKGESDIYKLNSDTKDKLLLAGKEIYKLIDTSDVKYLVVLEGQASKPSWAGNDRLSYDRALGLRQFWGKNGVNLQSLPNCEVIVGGSGEGGIPRDTIIESKNQRFLVYIIPKYGKL